MLGVLRLIGWRSGAKVALLLRVIGSAAYGASVSLAQGGDTRAESHRACVPMTWRRCVLDVLRPDGIGRLRFGASPGVVRTAIDSLLGQPGGADEHGGTCGIDHQIKWWDQWTGSGEPALTVYLRRRAFVGYQAGDPPGPSVLRNPPGGWSLATTRGLRVGNTLARGRKLYGPAFTASTAQGGSWRVRVSAGLIIGYASAVPGHGVISRVATIDAGDVGCPAVTP